MTGNDRTEGWLERADKFGRFLENSLLASVLSAMILLAALQILLRNVTGTGFAWADEALRLMVLWIAMLGAVAASRDYRHISIDILSRFLAERYRAWTSSVVDLFTAVVALVLAWYAGVFVLESYEFGDLLLEEQPAWVFQAILPVGFALIGYRYVVWFARRVRDIVAGAAP